jgi:peptide/nickel transport system substrate-binding protein
MTIRLIRQLAIPAALAAILISTAPPALAGKSNDTLTWLSNSEPDNIDMYQNTLREGIILGRMIWDSLMEVDPKTGDFKPSLAKSYKWIDATTIQFELRDDVVFHNGEKFSADDVVATMNYLGDPKNKVKSTSTTKFIAGAEKLGPYKVNVKLKYPFPAAMQYLSSVDVIYPKSAFKDGAPKGMATKPIGTGPYKAVEVSYGKRFVFEKFDKYMKGGPKTPHIGKIIYRRIEERGTQMAELLSGGADWIWRVPPDLAKNLNGRKGITVTQGETMRVGFIQMDASGKSGNTPMKKLKVREAISYAIDRDTIRKTLMGNASRILNAACFPTQFGCDDSGVKHYTYDPKKAKALLAEAGYPKGFSTPIFAYRDRPIAEAIIGQLAKVGIKAKLNYLTAGAIREYRRTKGTPLSFGTWGSSSINDVTAILGNWFQGSADDNAQDKTVIDLLNQGNTTDQEVRKKVYKKALDRISEQAYWLPLFSWVYNYAYVDTLQFTPDPDEVPRFWNAKWK